MDSTTQRERSDRCAVRATFGNQPLTRKHLEDAKTGSLATKIRILQMPHAGDN